MIKLIQCECELTDLVAYREVFQHEVVTLNSPVKVLVIDSRMSVVPIYEQVEHVVGCLGGGQLYALLASGLVRGPRCV